MWLFIYIFWIFVVFVIHPESSKCKQLTIFEHCDSKGVLYLFPHLKKVLHIKKWVKCFLKINKFTLS